MDGKQLDLENEVRVGRNLGQRALTAVPQRGRNPQLPLSPDHHESYSFVPARNDLADAELEGERLAAHATVEFLAVLLQPTRVVDNDNVAARGWVTGAFLQVNVLQSRWVRDHFGPPDHPQAPLLNSTPATSATARRPRWFHSTRCVL